MTNALDMYVFMYVIQSELNGESSNFNITATKNRDSEQNKHSHKKYWIYKHIKKIKKKTHKYIQIYILFYFLIICKSKHTNIS